MAWNRSDGTAGGIPARRGLSPSPRARRTAAFGGALLALAALAADAWWLARGREGAASALRPSAASRSPSPASCPSSASFSGPGPAANTPKGSGGARPARPSSAVDALPPHRRIVETVSVVTNADGSVLVRFRTADGKLRSRQSAPRPVFDNASDQILAMAVSGASSGGSMPPMPLMDNADEAFARSLEKDIEISDGDSDAVKALKRDVMAVREEVRQLMAEGHTFADVMKDHRDMVNRSAEMRREAARIVGEFVESGDMASAEECRAKLNAALAEAGMEGIEMPLSREERRAAVRERSAGGAER